MQWDRLGTLLAVTVLTATMLIGCGISGDATQSTGIASDAAQTDDVSELETETGSGELTIADYLATREPVDQVGEFVTEDIYGTEYTQDVFHDYDLTLVNMFATWCSPCVQELPELEKLRKQYEEDGVSIGVVAMVMNVKSNDGTVDETALEDAQILYKKSKAHFPYLIPDDGYLNGRASDIIVYPESFFVDREGNIVSDPYIGARSLDEWDEIARSELTALEADS